MTDTPPSNGFTQKEMLVKIDGKLDLLSGRIQTVEVKQAVYDARLTEDSADKARIQQDLSEARHAMDEKVDALRKGQTDIGRAVKYATATIASLVFLSDLVIRFLTK